MAAAARREAMAAMELLSNKVERSEIRPGDTHHRNTSSTPRDSAASYDNHHHHQDDPMPSHGEQQPTARAQASSAGQALCVATSPPKSVPGASACGTGNLPAEGEAIGASRGRWGDSPGAPSHWNHAFGGRSHLLILRRRHRDGGRRLLQLQEDRRHLRGRLRQRDVLEAVQGVGISQSRQVGGGILQEQELQLNRQFLSKQYELRSRRTFQDSAVSVRTRRPYPWDWFRISEEREDHGMFSMHDSAAGNR